MDNTKKIYTGKAVRELDRLAIHEHGMAGYALMTRAGAYLFDCILATWPSANSIAFFCGAGNNAGDAYVSARLAWQAGWSVRLISLIDENRLRGDALTACKDYQAVGGVIERWTNTESFTLLQADVIVDGLLGTGVTAERPVTGLFAEVISSLNQLRCDTGVPVVAIDMPSGLQADTGQVCGVAVEADMTVTFIGMKLGLLTGQGCRYCGNVRFSDLSLPKVVYTALNAPAIDHLDAETVLQCLPPRVCSAHKGQHGHALLIGGAVGMRGAIQLAGEAALRTGAGLVTIGTAVEHVHWVNVTRPELMVHALQSSTDLRALLLNPAKSFKAIAIGPGLGQTTWSRSLLTGVLNCSISKVLDADALNLLAKAGTRRDDWILTPHPAEAARLLACDVATIEQDRLVAVQQLQAKYGGVVVLKGAGSLIASVYGVSVCTKGNPGMASGGMGDVLTGIIAALLAQGLSLYDAARCGVWIHAYAADLAAEQRGERGLLASDLIAYLQRVVNRV